VGDVVRLSMSDDCPVDLDDSDVEAISAEVGRIEGGWDVKYVRISHSVGVPEPKWAYIFHRGPATDANKPILSITRTKYHYTVVCWDILQFIMEGHFTEHRSDSLEDSLCAVHELVDPTKLSECAKPTDSVPAVNRVHLVGATAASPSKSVLGPLVWADVG